MIFLFRANFYTWNKLILQDANQELEPFALKLSDNTRKDVGSAIGF